MGKRLLLNNAGLNQWVGHYQNQTGARGVLIRYQTKDIRKEMKKAHERLCDTVGDSIPVYLGVCFTVPACTWRGLVRTIVLLCFAHNTA